MLGDYPMPWEQTEYVRKCIEDNDLHRFYTWAAWLNLRVEVLRDDKGECQHCKRQGKYIKATHVHHIGHVRSHPELGRWSSCCPVVHGSFISLCHACHELQHPERQRKKVYRKPVTEETILLNNASR